MNEYPSHVCVRKQCWARFLCVPVLVLMVGHLAGCAVTDVWLPEKEATVQEAFRTVEPPPDPQVARQAVVRQVFQAPYEDVYRAASVAATKSLFNVEAQNKRVGHILATEIVRRQTNINTQSDALEYDKFYYAVLVNELGPRRTQVTIMTKVQARCFYPEVGVGIHIASLGTLAALNRTLNREETCKFRSNLRWAAVGSGDKYRVTPNRTAEMMQFMTILRSNLINAGAL